MRNLLLFLVLLFALSACASFSPTCVPIAEDVDECRPSPGDADRGEAADGESEGASEGVSSEGPGEGVDSVTGSQMGTPFGSED